MDKSLTKKEKKADIQLLLLDNRKNKIKKEIYRIYDLYLKSVRSLVNISLKKSIYALVDLSKEEINTKESEIIFFINNEIKLLINNLIPLLTIEQLTIYDYPENNNLSNTINPSLSNSSLEDQYFYSNNSNNENYLSFNFYGYDYYNINYDKNSQDSIDLDNHLNNKYKCKERLDDIKNYDSNLIKASSELNILDKEIIEEKAIMKENLLIPEELKKILKWVNYLDKSLNNTLRQFAIDVNKKLVEKKFIKSFINDDLLSYLFDNDFLVNNPFPFISLFDLTNNPINNFEQFELEIDDTKIYLFYLNSTEMEYYDVNLNILRNKISEVKYNLTSLIKKEKYWKNKKLYSNYNKSLINNI